MIDASWRKWVAENLLLNKTRDSIAEAMVIVEPDSETRYGYIDEVASDPLFTMLRGGIQPNRKLESVVRNLQQCWELNPNYTTIERRTTPGEAEFYDRYVAGCRPAIFTDMTDGWAARHAWTPELLRDRFAGNAVQVQRGRNNDPKYEENSVSLRSEMPWEEFVDEVTSGGPNNDIYLTANNRLFLRPAFESLLEDIGALPEFVARHQLRDAGHFWFGPGGTHTPLHHDTVILFHSQLIGRKRWRFISPLEVLSLENHRGVFSRLDVNEHVSGQTLITPNGKTVQVIDAICNPGDTLFLPMGWWHAVDALDVSVSLSFSCIRKCPSSFTFENP